jgi:segregation and condensation protein B
MATLETKIEALLFLATKPLSLLALLKALGEKGSDVEAALITLAEKKNTEESGIHLINNGDEWQLVTNPVCAELGEKLAKDEDGALTRPSLEALTIIAYRGPVTKPEIEAIRGVNCTLILRNLLTRGLIEEEEDSLKGQSVYSLSLEAVRFLGLHDVRELPSYEDLHQNAKIEKLLSSLSAGDKEMSAV